ncbi:MAG: HAD family hydrolase [Hyphomicrobiales bacterium]|nr:HAD family hydrolase [Hyphomicrobiales bacterium]
MKPPGLVIFDCDGVLVDSEPIACRVLAGLLTELGYPMTADGCRDRFTGISIPTLVADVEGDWGRPLPADFETRLRDRDREVFARELQPIPGIEGALKAITAPVCVASSGTEEKIRHSLTVTGLIGYFEPHIFSARAVPRGKPAPDLFLHAARAMGTAPADCLVVEDSVAGITAARAAAMAVLGFAGGGHCGPGYAQCLRAAGAPVVFDDMARLPDLVTSP